jgi:Fe-S cluster biogenesis protein NfuA/nitrite reductase/ring-hydroxylating ferredoxin subunit
LSTDTEALVGRVEELTAQLEAIGDPFARSCAEELVGALMGLYGEGLERIFEAIAEEGSATLRDRLTEDGVVASLMLIHGLYPVALETRVQEALDSVRPYMESHGGNVELLGIEDGIAKLRLEGSCDGCPASASTMELAIEQALQDAAPDLEGIDVEGVTAPPPPLGAFELPMSGGGPPASGWLALEGLDRLAPGAVTGASAGGKALVVANVAGDLLAYRNRCAGCGGALDHGDLAGGTLHCPSCARGFELPLAGRCVSEAGLQLEPVPLLREDGGGVRVALAA